MAATERYRIMLVDDDEDLRALMRAALSSKYEIVEALDGLDALHKLPDYQPDLAIIDVEMPLMNGLDLCASIRKHPDFRGIPVLFLSAHGGKENLKAGYAVGADLFMIKPLDPLRVLKNVDFTIEQDKPPLRRKKLSIQAIHQMEAAGHSGVQAPRDDDDTAIPLGDPILNDPTPPPRAPMPPHTSFSTADSPPPHESKPIETPEPQAPNKRSVVRPIRPQPVAKPARESGPPLEQPAEPERPKPTVRPIRPQPVAKSAPTGNPTEPPAPQPSPQTASYKVTLPPDHPTRKAAEAPPRPSRPAPAGAPRARVMIVDNEEDARQLVDLALRDKFEITTAHDGLDAIEKIVGYQPDLLLVDVMMPRMNGFHLLQSIRRNPNYQHVPVMIVTGRASERDREYAMRVGANDFLAKPFSTEDLINRVMALTQLPSFRIAPKKIPIEEIIEREYLIAKEKQKEKADAESREEFKRAMTDLKEIMDDPSRHR